MQVVDDVVEDFRGEGRIRHRGFFSKELPVLAPCDRRSTPTTPGNPPQIFSKCLRQVLGFYSQVETDEKKERADLRVRVLGWLSLPSCWTQLQVDWVLRYHL